MKSTSAPSPSLRPATLAKVFKLGLAALFAFTTVSLKAATATIYANDFEAYTAVATSEADTADADPTGAEWVMADDAAIAAPTAAGAGVQVQSWLKHGGANALLVRSGTAADVNLLGARSGSQYTLDFWLYVHKGTGDRSFRFVLQGEGADLNGAATTDYIAYNSVQTAGTSIRYYDGVANGNTGAWVTSAAAHTEDTWQHHRIVIDPAALKMQVFIDDMVTPVVTDADLARCEVAVPTYLRILHEGNSADGSDGYIVVDDFSFTVENSRDLATTFAEGFEGYTAREASDDDADPAGPWITTETDGVGTGRALAPAKIQVVDSTVVTPHSGTKCLKLEGGQRAGASIAWGVPPQTDVQITWWARVPASPTGGDYNYLRMSLYGAEGGNTLTAGDSALLGYACRSSTVGTPTSLTYFVTGWLLTGFDFTPETWEEYRMTTHNSVGKYTIVKNPNSANPQVIVDRKPLLGTATTWGPTFMAAWSSSNITNHPPVYVDDIEIKSLVSNPDPLPTPYTVHLDGTRFTNSTTIALSGPIGSVAVDPRDNSTIVFAVDASSGGGIYKATKVASGNWSVDTAPLVTGLSNPSGLTVATNGTIWWVNDYTSSLMRLAWPWTANTPETVIADFILPGAVDPAAWLDDDTFDLRFAPPSFIGSVGGPTNLIVMDRGVDGNANDALFLVDPETTALNQTNYSIFLFGPTATDLGAGDLVGMTTLPATAEIVTLNFSGQVTAVDANGTARSFWPDFYGDRYMPIAPASIATDPTSGRLWISDDLTNEVWSCASDGTGGQRELSFPLTNPERSDLQMDFQEPGMVFAPDGSFMVLSDTSTGNGGGRLIIFHNETFSLPTFSIQSVARVADGVQLTWQSAGSAKYDVLRGADIAGTFESIATNTTATSYKDTNAPAGAAFYRVVAKP